MGIIDLLSRHTEERDKFFNNIPSINERIKKLMVSDFHFEAAIMAIVLIEEFLRIEVDFFQGLLQSSAFNVKDENLNIVLGIDFDKLGLRTPSDLTLGQLINRHYAFCKNDDLKTSLIKINSMRTELLHKPLREENSKYFHKEKETLVKFTEETRYVAIKLHTADNKIIQDFFTDLVRKTGSDKE